MKSDTPLISMIIPAHDAEHFIEECLTSVLSQTYRNLEVLVVDDDSTDTTRQIINQFQAQDQRVKYLAVNEHNAAQTRRRGLAKASADLVCFTDADDIIDTRYVEILYEASKKTGSKIACGKVMNIMTTNDIHEFPGDSNRISKETNLLAFFGDNYHSQQISKYIAQTINAKLFSKDLFEDIDYSVLKTSILEDNYIMAQLLSKVIPNEIALIDTTIYYYRQNSHSTMGTVLDHLIPYGDKEISYPTLFDMTMDYVRHMFKDTRDAEFYTNKIKSEEYLSMAEVVVDRNMRFEGEERQIATMSRQIKELEEQVADLKRKLQDLLGSTTYKVGRAVTYPLRTIKHRIKR